MSYYKDKLKRNNKFRKELIKRATPSELLFIEILNEMNIVYIFQKGFVKGNLSCIVDFYIPKPYKLCIEIDGGYHNEEIQIKKDKNRDKYLEEFRNFNVLHFTNEEIDKEKDNVIRLINIKLKESKNKNINKTLGYYKKL